jgi:hypothetical protein
LARQVDGVVLVVELGKTRHGKAEQAINNLRHSGANLLGAVLSPISADQVVTTKLKKSVVSTMNGRFAHTRNQRWSHEQTISALTTVCSQMLVDDFGHLRSLNKERQQLLSLNSWR